MCPNQRGDWSSGPLHNYDKRMKRSCHIPTMYFYDLGYPYRKRLEWLGHPSWHERENTSSTKQLQVCSLNMFVCHSVDPRGTQCSMVAWFSPLWGCHISVAQVVDFGIRVETVRPGRVSCQMSGSCFGIVLCWCKTCDSLVVKKVDIIACLCHDKETSHVDVSRDLSATDNRKELKHCS